MTQKNNITNSLRFYVIKYMVIFAAATIIFVIFFQSVFFKTSYKSRLYQTVDDVADVLVDDFVNGIGTTFYDRTIHYATEDNIYTNIYDSNYNLIPEITSDINKKINKYELYKVFDSLNNEIEKIEEIDNKSILVDITKVNLNNEIYYVVVYTDIVPINTVITALNYELYMVILAIVFVSIFLSYYLSKRVTDPIKALEKKARKLSKNDPNLKFDISDYEEVKSLCDTLNYANLELCKTSKLQKNLMANVSHDLRTPLTLIKAYAEMIKDISGDNPEKRNEHLDIIIKETDRLTNLVNNILQNSKLENEELKLTEFNFKTLVTESLASFKVLEADGYKFEVIGLTDELVYADFEKIKQVMYNLISNAVNYTVEKIITIKITKTDNLLVEIIDRGKGIPKEKLDNIWERYYRDEENHVRSVVGSGLGLSIVKKILENHKFEYGVKSEIDKGTTFYFVIKLKN